MKKYIKYLLTESVTFLDYIALFTISLIIVIGILIGIPSYSQKVKQGSEITVTNFAWDCGGYSPQKAYVVKRKGKLYIKFDFEYGGTEKSQYMPIDSAFKYWKDEETKIVIIKY